MAASIATSMLPLEPAPPSPTLTNPDMILPFGDSFDTSSPETISIAPLHILRTSQNSRATTRSSSRSSSNTVTGKRSTTPNGKGYAPMSQINETEATPMRRPSGDRPLASSPILREMPSVESIGSKNSANYRRSSIAASSVYSEDLENFRWPGFDSESVDGDNLSVLQESEYGDEQRSKKGSPEPSTPERWKEKDFKEREDPLSSAALSRRAEIILANAKKRLNLMEGNLRGARSSLVATPSSTPEGSTISRTTSVSSYHSRPRYNGLGISGSGPRYIPQHVSNSTSPGHTRGHSDFSSVSARSPSYTLPHIDNAHYNNSRAASVTGTASRPKPADEDPTSRHLRGTKSHEVMRDSYHTHSRLSESRPSPPTLGPLPEDDPPVNGAVSPKPESLSRPTSSAQTHELRAQMEDLKGRISSLRDRAREEGLRRKSMQSLRTPSPFTAAEVWYQGAEAYRGSTFTSDAGVGWSPTSPNDDAKGFFGNNLTVPGAEEREGTAIENDHDDVTEYSESLYEDAEEAIQQPFTPERHSNPRVNEDVEDDATPRSDRTVTTNSDLPEDDNDDCQSEAEVFHPVLERHEDRADAFDYEHFFLHSALGSITNAGRRSSSSSCESVETARGPARRPSRAEISPIPESPSRPVHDRSYSLDSVSSANSFATATEGYSPVKEKPNAVRSVPSSPKRGNSRQQWSIQPVNGLQPVMEINPRPDSAVDIHDEEPERPSTARSFPLANTNFSMKRHSHSPPSVTDFAARRYSASPADAFLAAVRAKNLTTNRGKPMSGQDQGLVKELLQSLEKVCLRLQDRNLDGYEASIWRRRLDEATKTLNGEQEGEAF